jgi:hypothetical protein
VCRRFGLALIVLALVGCGSSSGRHSAPAAGTLDALWHAGSEAVGLVSGTTDYSPGAVRISFLVVRRNAAVVSTPRARVFVARSLGSRPFARGWARLERIGVRGGYTADSTQIYVTRLRLPEPGRYWLVAAPVGSRVRGLATLDVRPSSKSPEVGSRAVPSRTPTLASTNGDVAKLTTGVPPDRGLLRYSIAESLAARKPFVVVFATPKFCESRTCGPVVDVVDAVRRRFSRTDVRFIHVEIFRRNNPTLGPNAFVREWRLPSEPWTFLVGADGRIKAKFPGPVSVRELAAAVRSTLL